MGFFFQVAVLRKRLKFATPRSLFVKNAHNKFLNVCYGAMSRINAFFNVENRCYTLRVLNRKRRVLNMQNHYIFLFKNLTHMLFYLKTFFKNSFFFFYVHVFKFTQRVVKKPAWKKRFNQNYTKRKHIFWKNF